MTSHARMFCLALVGSVALAVGAADCWAQPGYYTYDIYGGRFNGATMRPGLFAQAATSPPGYAPAANVAFGTPAPMMATANPCNPCTTVARPVCDPCATTAFSPVQPTVAYSPVTSYRWGFTRTQFRPVVGCDACGNQTVNYEAYRTLLPRFTRIPVTTFQPTMVGAAPSFAGMASNCNTCAPSYGSSVMQSSFVAPSSSCSGCSAGQSTYPSSTGALPVPSLRPTYEYDSYSNGSTSTQRVIIEQQPLSQEYSNGNSNGTGEPSRIETQRTPAEAAPKAVPQEESRLKALPPAEPEVDYGSTQDTRVPRLFDPNDKSAAYEPMHRFEVAPAAYNTHSVRHVPSGARPLDDSGWQSAR